MLGPGWGVYLLADVEGPDFEDLCLSYAYTAEDLGYSLERLRKRNARRCHGAVPTFRDIARQTGYGHSTLSQYFNGSVLPPPERLHAVVQLLGAEAAEADAFAALRDELADRRRLGIDASAPYDNRTGARELSPEVATSRLLRELLDIEPYRTRWKRLVRPLDGPVEALALLISRHLNAVGEVVQEPDIFRKRIARAIETDKRGVVLSSATLGWFMDALDMSADDARQLRHLHAGSPAIRYVRGVANETRLPLLELSTALYRTVDLREYHYLGPDGLPYKHHTDRIVQAMEDGYDRFVYAVDTSALAVEVHTGGVPGPLYRIRAKSGAILYATDIVLDAPLARDDTAVLNYTTTLRYEEPPPPEMRYVFRSRVDKFLLSVQFHADRLPSRLWWCEWHSLEDSQITHREPVALNPVFGAHRFLDGGVERAIVGFRWEW